MNAIRHISLVLLTLFPAFLYGQDLTGVWKGYLSSGDSKLAYEVVISGDDFPFSGYALTIFTVQEKENLGIKTIRLRKKSGQYLLEDDELIFNNYSSRTEKVQLIANLELGAEDTTMVFTGDFRTRSLDLRAPSSRSYSGKMYLQKQDPAKTTRLTAQLDKMNLLQSLSFIPKSNMKKETDLDLANSQSKTIPTPLPEEAAIPVRIRMTARENTLTMNRMPNRPVHKIKGPLRPAVTAPPLPAIDDDVALLSKHDSISTPNEETILTKRIRTTSRESVLAINRRSDREPKKLIGHPKPIITAPPLPDVVITPELVKEKNSPALSQNQDLHNQGKTDTLSAAVNMTTKTVTAPVPETRAATDLARRKMEVIRSIDFSSDSLVLSLYDNGTVDGDTVSVVLNGVVIMPRKGLTTQAIRMTVPVTREMGDSLVLVMFAENLGSIPPNSGLLIIQSGAERHEIRFAGDLQKSSAVVLRRRSK